ncbi:MAG: alpha-E domain-containing protein, partial [Nitrospinaceae bacterium]
MLSRVADSIYWMSRYLERAENAARFIDTQLQMMLDLPPMRKDPKAWEALVHITGDDAYFKEKYGQPNQENVMFFHTFDTNYPNSIVSCLQAARENARSVREIIPSEMWEHINRLHLKLATIKVGKAVFQNPHQFYNNIKLSSHLILGIIYATMSQNEAWQFGAMGRFLERADKTSRILDVKYFLLLPGVDYVGSAWDTVQWTALLKSTSASEMYRKRFNLIDPKHIVEFLL